MRAASQLESLVAQSLLAVGLLVGLPSRRSHAEAPTDPPGRYTTSWLGNSYMDTRGHRNVTEALHDLWLGSGGRIFTAGYAESWGGGAEYDAKDGAFIARYDRFDSGFGDPVAVVAADDTHVYFGAGKRGLLRSKHGGGNGGYEAFLPGVNVQGLHLRGRRLYVSDFDNGRIRVLDLATMSETAGWPCESPTRLTVDDTGRVWVVVFGSDSVQKPSEGPMWWGRKVVSFDAAGIPGPEIGDFEKPLSLAVDRRGRLLVGGLNEHSQIWLYDIAGTPRKVGTFGARGGIFSGTSGEFTRSAKLHWIKAIAVDEQGDIVTGCTYGTFWGNCIERWDPAGGLRWRLFAGTSLDGAGLDPEDETQVYSKYHHYALDYSRTTPGSEWSLRGFTVNRFRHPEDPRVDQNTDVGSRSLGAGAFRLGGRLFVGRSNQEGYRFELFRQESGSDGEVLVPSFKLGTGGDANNHFYDPATRSWIHRPKKEGLYNQYWNIARNGDLFTVGDPQTVIHYRFGGLDPLGNPIWDATNATTSVVSALKPIRRLVYDSDSDVMYMAGDVKEQNWGSFLRVKRFKEWSKGNRVPDFTAELPYQDAEYAGNSNYGGGQPASFSVAGEYIFVLYGVGHVRILGKADGKLVGTLRQDVNGWLGSDGQVDAAYGMTASLRRNGEYVILFENAAWANIMMTRWCPDGDCPNPTTAPKP
jgi:hypothetical protein